MYLVPNVSNHVSCRCWRFVVSPGRYTRGQSSMPAASIGGLMVKQLATMQPLCESDLAVTCCFAACPLHYGSDTWTQRSSDKSSKACQQMDLSLPAVPGWHQCHLQASLC